MLFEIENISNNISTLRRLFCNNHENNRADHFPLQKNEVGQSVTSFLNRTAEKAVHCCTLMILGMQTIGFLQVLFFSSQTLCKCLYYILIRLSAINIVDYLFLSTECFNRGRLIWNSNASPKFDFLHANTNYTKTTPHLQCEIYM